MTCCTSCTGRGRICHRPAFHVLKSKACAFQTKFHFFPNVDILVKKWNLIGYSPIPNVSQLKQSKMVFFR